MKRVFPFQHARFVTSALKLEQYPCFRNSSGEEWPEVAVAGRSNVGKSSLLNDLFQSKSLVKTSSTPGKTQCLNFFTVDEQLVFSDLPGYGYAKVPLAIRKQWGPMVQEYLKERKSLKVILFLFDIRRVPNADDLQFMEWVAYHQKAVILVFTKVDKVNQKEKRDNTKKILEKFDTENLHYVHYSTKKNIGRQILITTLIDAIQNEEDV